MKKKFAFLMAALCLVSMLSACGSPAASNSTPGANESNSGSGEDGTPVTLVDAYANVQKPDKISWWVHDGMRRENGTDLWVAEFEAKTGIKLELDIIDNNEYYKKLELAYAGDTVPDTFDLDGDHLGIYVAQNAIADLTDLVHESGLYDLVDARLWDAITVNGKIYGVPREFPSSGITYVRKDWLDRLGMEIPTTYDEFITMLTRFQKEIPECTVPYTAPGLSSAQAMPDFFQGAVPNFVKVDGQWVDGMQQDNMLAALQRMQDAYAAGLIDMEVVTNTTGACRDQWYSGCVGAFNYWAGNWGNTLQERVQQNVPEAEVIAIPPIEGTDYLLSVPSVQVISSRLSDEEIASIFKYFVEYARDGGEGQVLFQNGVEGVHWEQDGDNLKFLPCLSNPEEVFRKAWIAYNQATTPMNLTDKNITDAPAITDSLAISNEYAQVTYAFPVSETRTMITAEMTTTRDNVLARVVMGQMTPEDGIAEYKAAAERLGVDKALAEMNGN